MTLTRIEFDCIARVMKERVEVSSRHPEVVNTIRVLAIALQITNERFDHDRFLKACGIDDALP